MELVGTKPLHLLTQTVLSLKSPTGAFIASQTLIFRKKKKKQSEPISYRKQVRIIFVWSEWRESNSRPLEPHSSALPKLRYTRISSSASLPKHRRQEILYSDAAVLSTAFLNFFVFFEEKSDLYAHTPFYLLCSARRSLSFSSSGFRYWPVKLPGTSATCSGVPSATISPPALPPSGPRSMI